MAARHLSVPEPGATGRPDTARPADATSGVLVLIATPIGHDAHLGSEARSELGRVDVLACEDTRRTGRLLAALNIAPPRLRSIRRENEAAAVAWTMRQLEAGRRVGLVSDAGLPGISDPGERLVAGVRAAGGTVSVVPGRSAVSEAVARVPWAGAGFVMVGFLARSGRDRRRALDAVARSGQPTVIFESPRRVEATLRDLAEACGDERRAVVAKELTKTHERVVIGTLATPIGDPRGEYVIVVDALPQGVRSMT